MNTFFLIKINYKYKILLLLLLCPKASAEESNRPKVSSTALAISTTFVENEGTGSQRGDKINTKVFGRNGRTVKDVIWRKFNFRTVKGVVTILS